MGYEGMAAKIMAKHSKEEHRSSLSITVIEARGLRPRHGTLTACYSLSCTLTLLQSKCLEITGSVNLQCVNLQCVNLQCRLAI